MIFNIDRVVLGGVGAAIVLLLGSALTPAPAEAETFHTIRSLLASRFSSSQRVSYVRVQPTDGQRGAIERRLGHRLRRSQYDIYVATSGERVDGYAIFDEERGQHEMISFGTFFDGGGRVTDVEVMAYREPYGDGIRTTRFRRQFVGRTSHSSFRLNDDIDAVSGSTISSRSMTRVVHRACVLLETMVLSERHERSARL